MIQKIIFASGNDGKWREIANVLQDTTIAIISLDQYPDLAPGMEDGSTYLENAMKKAAPIVQATGLPTLADDTGLEVAYLKGAPGLHAARYAGEQCSPQDNMNKMLQELQGVPWEQRKACFRSVLVLLKPDQSYVVVEGILEGYISLEPKGEQGFGYDPIFFVPELGKTLAELTLAEKNKISHRAKALQQLKNYLVISSNVIPVKTGIQTN